MVLDYLSNTLQNYEKNLNYANILTTFFNVFYRLITLRYSAIRQGPGIQKGCCLFVSPSRYI